MLIIYPRMTLSKRDIDFDSDKMPETDFAYKLLCYQPVVRIIEGWNLVVSKVGIGYDEFKKQYDEITD